MSGEDRDKSVRGRRAAIAAVTFVAALASAALGLPSAASALTVKGSSAVVSRGAYAVRMASDDPTGTVRLVRDGVVVATARATPGTTLTFPRVVFSGLGWHSVRASLESTSLIWSAPLRVRAYSVPARPVLMSSTRGGVSGRRMRLRVRVGSQTYSVAVWVNGKLVRTVRVKPRAVNDLGFVSMPGKRNNTLLLRAGNAAATSRSSVTLRRLTYPDAWHTCILIDKSELRLYRIVDDVLVKWYRVATGRPSLPTPSAIWRIGVKWTADPNGPYGGRMMGMFMLRRGKYYFTPYFIHGTNKPESIGTYASHGCVRMYPADARELYDAVPLYTPVKTQD
jgi:lipoprotein-anchoring transpeptidase ErfK/SrfK